ncbi:hypothetical protein [Lysinibacillus sp. FSL K6-0102]|uniref:hypothetical protein n=1 Tax=Lysinibacillus sp. FSL K6-0102 TaxID=2975290 RepID=UPI0030F52156
MDILTDYKDLVGKKIVFSHMAQFAEQITLATEDGCVIMATFDYDEMAEESRVRVMYPHSVIQVLERHEWIRNELGRLGIFDIEKYKEEQRIKQEKEKEELRKRQEVKELAEYARLKAKYEK